MSSDFTTLPDGTKITWVKLDPVQVPDTWSFTTTTSSVTLSPTSAASSSSESTMAIGETYNRGRRDAYTRYDHEDGWVFLVLEGDSWSTLVFEDEEDAEHFLATGRTRYIHAKTQLTDNSLRHTGNAWVREHGEDEPDGDAADFEGLIEGRTVRAEGPASRPVIKLPEM